MSKLRVITSSISNKIIIVDGLRLVQDITDEAVEAVAVYLLQTGGSTVNDGKYTLKIEKTE
jgi:hypothetical protein